MLITDYSSIMIEFALLNKPIIFFTYDYDSYLTKERGFYFDFKSSVPGPVVYDSNQLINVIEKNEFDENKISEFVKTQFNEIDGQASKRVVDFLLK
jgi:CDP-ribitol ribitolphosphotransferase